MRLCLSTQETFLESHQLQTHLGLRLNSFNPKRGLIGITRWSKLLRQYAYNIILQSKSKPARMMYWYNVEKSMMNAVHMT